MIPAPEECFFGHNILNGFERLIVAIPIGNPGVFQETFASGPTPG
jgi:hypothetical protein